MSELYDRINSNSLESNKEYLTLYAPNFTRTRQIYKGPRDSEKVNLEINQMLWDLHNINDRIEYIKTTQEDIMSAFENGYVADDPDLVDDQYPNVPDATMYQVVTNSTVSFTFLAIEELQYKATEFIEFINDYANGVYTNG